VGRWTSQDPAGFAAGDANLYRYAANDSVNARDPTGLADEDVKPQVEGGKLEQGVDRGVLVWPVKKPAVPKDVAKLNLYTYVDMSWEIKQPGEKEKPRQGKYRFWLEGVVLPGATEGDTGTIRFNLSPFHGSHMGGDNKRPEWPVFDGETSEARDKQLDEYLKKSFDLKNTVGKLTIHLEFRGYEKAAEGFNKPLAAEQGGPFEEPGTTKSRDKKDEQRTPNRLRTPFRTLAPWTPDQPKIWGGDPKWKYAIDLEYKWDWTGDDFKGTYTQSYDGKKTEGTTPYPKK
jgi:hypothetical protein